MASGATTHRLMEGARPRSSIQLALVVQKPLLYSLGVSTLAEIEAAADALTPEQQQELLLFLVARLRAQGARPPEPRRFPGEQIAKWIARDEADMQQFREGE